LACVTKTREETADVPERRSLLWIEANTVAEERHAAVSYLPCAQKSQAWFAAIKPQLGTKSRSDSQKRVQAEPACENEGSTVCGLEYGRKASGDATDPDLAVPMVCRSSKRLAKPRGSRTRFCIEMSRYEGIRGRPATKRASGY